MWSKRELIEKQARFWVLMAQGSTLLAACDPVGGIDELAVIGVKRPADRFRARSLDHQVGT